MAFVIGLVAVWVVFLGIWLLVSKFFKSADLTKVKERLSGVTKASKKNASKTTAAEPASVIHTEVAAKNKLAELLVEKYHLGPRIVTLLEQAGLRWAPAHLVHLCLVAFVFGLVFAWFALQIGRASCRERV